MKRQVRRVPRFHNPVGVIVRVFAAALAAGAVSFLVLMLNPGTAGTPIEGYVPGEVYFFGRLEINRPSLKVSVTSGRLVPVEAGGKVVGAVISGQGRFSFEPPYSYRDSFENQLGRPSVADGFDAMYVLGNYEEIEALRYSSGAQPTGADDAAVQQARDFLDARKTELSFATPFGVARAFALRPAGFLSLFAGRTLGDVKYSEGADLTLTFLTLEGRRISVPNPASDAGRGLASSLARPALMPVALVIYGSNILFLFLLAYVFTIDVDREHPPVPRGGHRLATDFWYLAALLVSELAFSTAEGRFYLQAWLHPAFEAGLALITVTYFWRRRYPFARLGMTRHNLLRGLAMGAFLGALSTFAMSLSYPRGTLRIGGPQLAIEVASSFLGVGLAQSIVQYGFLQTTLQRRLGPTLGMAATAWTIGLLTLLPELASGSFSAALAVRGLLFVPVGSLLLGYLFYRTENVAAPALARALIDFLPRVVKF